MAASSSSPPSHLLLLFFVALPSIVASTFKDIGIENPVVQLNPSPLAGSFQISGAKNMISCERIRVAGFSRYKIKSFANSFQVTLRPSELIPQKHYSKIEVCFHRNASISLCGCAKDEWKTMQDGLWSDSMSPFEDRFVDVRFTDGLSGSVTASLQEGPHHWRLLCLGLGFILLLLAPFVSQWVPFYYSSSMALGVLLVVLIILFQGMKLLPTGRKNVFYLTIYGSVLGVGSYLTHHFSMLVNSLLLHFGLSEDMHNPVSLFMLVGIFLSGAAFGYWIVRKFILSDDGTVNVGVVQFVKWAMRIIAIVLIFESTLDMLLAVATLSICWCISSFITSLASQISRPTQRAHYYENRKLWRKQALQASAHHKRAEFLSRSPNTTLSKTSAWKKSSSPYAWSTSPQNAMFLSSSSKAAAQPPEYYSSFHKMPYRKKFSRKEWDEFTSQSTREALSQWASSPEVTDWLVQHSDRIRVDPDESSDDDIHSSSESEGETVMEAVSRSGVIVRVDCEGELCHSKNQENQCCQC